MNANFQAALISGALSGVAGLLTFLLIHHRWIQPIWFILPIGLVLAVLGGLAVGWAYSEIGHSLPPRPWRILAMAALIAIILLPATILAELRSPMFDVTLEERVFLMSVGKAALIFIAELLLTAALAGALLGWWLGGNRRAATSMALAGVIFALGPGHNIPFIGGTGGVGKEWAIMGTVIFVSALVLVEAHARLT